MNEVLTPDGWGQVLRTESAHGRTSYLIKGAGFEGWYDGLQVQSDFADQPDDIIPNDDNNTVLPYPSRAQGPGWDGTTSTIPPDVDPHLEMDGNSDSLTGNPTGDDAVGADMDGLFEPHSRLSGARAHRLHNTASDDPILDVTSLPEESPTGLENSPINPDGVSTDDLFDGDNGFERAAGYDRLTIEDDLDFLRYAADNDDDGIDDKKKKHHHEQGPGYPGFLRDHNSDNDDDEDSDSDDDSSDSGDSGDSDGGDSGGDGGDGGGHTASFHLALNTTADLHFLANMCGCDEDMPMHSKSEHREIVAEGGLKNRKKKNKPLGNKPLTGHHGDHDPKTPSEAGYTHKAKGVAEVIKPKTKGRKKRPVERPIQYAASDTEVTDQPRDLDNLLERYQQDNFHFQESNLDDLVDHSEDDGDSADLYNRYASVGKLGEEDGYEKYIGSNGDGTYHLIASGGGKLPKGKQYGHYDSHQDAHDAVEAIIARNHSKAGSKTAAPAADPNAQPTQIESQIEQLMQFWAVDNNGWWHWTGSQADLALLNQMQQQMMAVGMPGGPPGQMQAQSATHTANPALLLPLLEGAGAEAGAAEGAAAGEAGGGLGKMLGGGGMPSPAGAAGGVAGAINSFNGGEDLGVSHHGVPFKTYGFAIEASTPAPWREYLQTVASDRLMALAAWADVVQKSKRLRAEGAIDLEIFKPEVITAYVQGDNGRYYTTVQRLGSVAPGVGRQLTSTQVSGWSCECDWGHWAWIRKRSFVGRMCSHAYALFSEMRSLDAKRRRGVGNGKPLGTVSSAGNKASWTRTAAGGFEWVSDDPTLPTAAITRTADGWGAHVWSDGTAEDSFDLGVFKNSGWAQRAISRVVTAHVKLADQGDVDVVGGGGDFPPGGSTSYDNPYTEDGTQNPDPLLDEYDMGPGPGIQEGTTRVGFSVFAEAATGDDDEGPEEEDNGIEEEEPEENDDESLDEEVAEDEDGSGDDSGESGSSGDDSEDEGDTDSGGDSGDGGHDEPHQRDEDGGDEGEGEGTDNPGDESDDDGIEKSSSVAELQAKFGLNHLAGANYSLADQDKLVREGDGKTARNRSDLNLTGTHYEGAKEGSAESPEDTLAFLF